MPMAMPGLNTSTGAAGSGRSPAWRMSGARFFDIHLAQGSAIAKEVLERIAELYQIEETIRGKPPGERQRIRQQHAALKLDSLKARLQGQLTRVSGRSAPADAIRYGLTRLRRLRSYLEDGRLAIDNNAAERGMRGIAVGQKKIGCSPGRKREAEPPRPLYPDRACQAQQNRSTGLGHYYQRHD